MENKNLLAIAEEFGNPIYVYDSSKIIAQYNRLSNAFKKVKHLKLNYAVKALSNISILKLMNSLGAGLDTVSIQEVQLGIKAGAQPSNIIFTPNGVSIEEIEEVSKTSENATVRVELWYGMKNGEATQERKTLISLVWDNAQKSWLIDFVE